MPNTSPRDWPRSVLTAASLVSMAVVIGILYWGQVVLIPIALAALITFLLSPLVTRLQRTGVPRVPAVVLVVIAAGAIVAGVGYVVAAQVNELANQLPSYRRNIAEKAKFARSLTRGGALEKLQGELDWISRVLEEEEKKEAVRERARESAELAQAAPDEPTAQKEEVPVAVEVQPEDSLLSLSSPETLSSVLEGVATVGLVAVLVIFMLIKREDLRNRLVSMAGQSSLAITTKALDEAGRRISRYLLMQFLLNATYGLAVGCCLFLIGVPYAVLWGLCAGVLRYIPYVGPWVAALLPISVSLMHSPGWTQVLLVVGLFVVLELISNNVMEPWLYGHSVGLSEVAVILAAVFWAWMWGPVGLVLATPMTVCLVVLGRYIPALSFLDRMLGERPALKAHIWFYQRLLARDEDEAAEVAEEHMQESPLEATCDELLLPTLSLVQRDRSRGHISEDDETFVLRAVEDILDDLVADGPGAAAPRETPAVGEVRPKVQVIGFPARDRADELALRMLSESLDPDLCEFEILSTDMLIAEKFSRIEEQAPVCVCLVSVPPGDLVQLRQLCKRLRSRWPELRIVSGRLGALGLSEKSRELLLASGADRAAGTLSDMRQVLVPIVQFYQQTGTASGQSTVAVESIA